MEPDNRRRSAKESLATATLRVAVVRSTLRGGRSPLGSRRNRAMTSIQLTPAERQELFACYRRGGAPEVQLRAHILLLLDAGHPWATVSAVLFCSVSTISRWKRRFEAEGVDAVLGRPRGRKRAGVHIWATLVVRWVLTLSPVDFRFARSRWSCEAAAVVLREDYRVRVGRETVRRWLREADLVWRRPRPTIRPKDPDREKKLSALRALLGGLPAPRRPCRFSEDAPPGGSGDNRPPGTPAPDSARSPTCSQPQEPALVVSHSRRAGGRRRSSGRAGGRRRS